MQPLTRDGDVRQDWRAINKLLAELEQAKRRLNALEHPNERRFQTEGGGGSMNYRRDYDAGETYAEGDVVRVRTGSNQGVYIAVQAVPAATAPEFPEPDPAYWHILSLGVITTYEVSDDPGDPIKTVYVNASEGYL